MSFADTSRRPWWKPAPEVPPPKAVPTPKPPPKATAPKPKCTCGWLTRVFDFSPRDCPRHPCTCYKAAASYGPRVAGPTCPTHGGCDHSVGNLQSTCRCGLRRVYRTS